jgi:hypothetical protein
LSAALDLSTLCSAWPAFLAWAVAIACVALAWLKRSSLELLAPPDRAQLLAELTPASENPEASEEVARRLAIAELNQRLADVSFQLDVLPATHAALIRISLASGSALALVGFLVWPDEAPLARAMRLVLAAFAGLSGAGGVAIIGRMAKVRSRQIKEKWDSSSRDIGKALGASLEAPAGNRGNSFPA